MPRSKASAAGKATRAATAFRHDAREPAGLAAARPWRSFSMPIRAAVAGHRRQHACSAADRRGRSLEIERQTRTRVAHHRGRADDLDGSIEASSRSSATKSRPWRRTRSEAVARRRSEQPGPRARRHPARRRLLRHRCRQGHPGRLQRAGDLHHRLSCSACSPATRPGADLPGQQPFDPRTVKAAISQALFFNSTASMAA